VKSRKIERTKVWKQLSSSNFPIFDNKEFYRLDFISYNIEKPRYSIQECEERGLTYSAPLKAKLSLSTKDDETEEYVNSVEQDVYLGNLPFMTESGTFIINGAERVIVSQLHRSPGVALHSRFTLTVLQFTLLELSLLEVPGLNLLQI
jgi:DNA-directed RNA polymerase subunit beta